MTAAFSPLLQELDAWAARGLTPRLWLRDDDAVADRPELRQLLALCGAAAIPPTLAVIPAKIEASLEAALSRNTMPMPSLLVHGYAHVNHEGPKAKKAELGTARPLAEVAADTAKGLALLHVAFPREALPVLVPPWNRVRPDLVPLLQDQGYEGISTFGPACYAGLGIIEANTHVDLMDWRARRGRSIPDVIRNLTHTLQRQRAADPAEPVGILTHHAVHDEVAWSCLADLADLVAGRVLWLSGREVFYAAP
ncbi:polysaccharide deacetylase [Rhodoligotrophos defluvii]|uniref:polysaccharide deacetylase n=1 Tax=Rhodoligotrophos defluvii TaxID=2561934 RepID=UPI0010C95A40|nr:polysaccharide deacetylase [Rhodoligotrophos defluvii]